MAEITALARRYAVDINLGTEASPSWQRLLGLADLKPNVEPTDQDDSDYDSDGWGQKVRTAADWSLEAKVNYKRDSETFEPNPVHLFLQNAAWSPGGSETYVQVRYFDRDGNADAWQGTALVKWTPDGGDRTALGSASVTFSGHGGLVQIASPANEAQTPTVTGLSPTTGPEAGGTMVTVSGSNFAGVTDVDFGATPATDFTVMNSHSLVAISPAGTGVVDVSVTTAEGVSPAGDASEFTYA